MSDLDKIINFRALADDGRTERTAINGHVRANFHVVADNNISNLRNFPVNCAVLNIAKAV
ncbi:MAG: hypothetical protein WDM76_07740 [Limisphaerales bacterium]